MLKRYLDDHKVSYTEKLADSVEKIAMAGFLNTLNSDLPIVAAMAISTGPILVPEERIRSFFLQSLA